MVNRTLSIITTKINPKYINISIGETVLFRKAKQNYSPLNPTPYVITAKERDDDNCDISHPR